MTWMLYWLGLQASHALAAGNPPAGGIQIQNPLGCAEATECVQDVLNGLIYLAAPIVAVMILVGGFQIMASGGNEEKLKTGKNTIIYAVVGFAIILLASGVAALIRDVISGGSGAQNPPPPADTCALICDPPLRCQKDSIGFQFCGP